MNLPANTFLQEGKYKIIRFINSGGFGSTYEGEHIMLKKRIAIKEFFVKDFCNRDEHSSQVTVGITSKTKLVERLKAKFIEEAVALCQLQHPNIVHVSDVFNENGTAYYVMDYIDGKSLHDIVLKGQGLPEAEALNYIRQVAKALKYVHSKNRLHLDIKPGNIMIDKSGQAILIDFGVSKQYDEENGENTSTLLGKTPGYAPIEQMSNSVQVFNPATDIYALGATLFKLVTGTTPPDATSIINDGFPKLPTSLSEPTKKAIRLSMKARKGERLQSIDEFLNVLDEEEDNGEGEVTVIDTDNAKREEKKEKEKEKTKETEKKKTPIELPTKTNFKLVGGMIGMGLGCLLIPLFPLYSLLLGLIVGLISFLLFNIGLKESNQIRQKEQSPFVRTLLLGGTCFVALAFAWACANRQPMAVVSIWIFFEGLLMLMLWKKWGYWITLSGLILISFAGPSYGSEYYLENVCVCLFTTCIISTVIWGLLKIRKNGKSSWKQLESGFGFSENKILYIVATLMFVLVSYGLRILYGAPF